MTAFAISDAAALLGVSDDTVRRWAAAGRLETGRDDAGRLVVPGEALARLAVERAERQADADAPLVRESARNRLPGVVTRVVRGEVMSQVELQAGPHRVVSLLSTEAVDELGLVPGAFAVASVKATQVVVEVPR